MSEFFLELFSEEIPPKLQIEARETLLNKFKEFFNSENIRFDKVNYSLSTPNRLIIYFKMIQSEIIKHSKEIRGPNIRASESAIEGFLKSNKIKFNNLYKKKSEKGEFYFYKTPKIKFKTKDLLQREIPNLLSQIKWKKSMKWGDYDLFWGRPLKSIMTLYKEKPIIFNFHHLKSSNNTYIDKDFELKKKSFKSFNAYINFFNSIGIIIDQKKRKDKIEKELYKISKKKNYLLKINLKLLEDVSNIVEKPKVIYCSFDKKFLDIPKEVIVTTIEKHQKFFPELKH